MISKSKAQHGQTTRITLLCVAVSSCCSNFFYFFGFKSIFRVNKWQKLTIKSGFLDLIPAQGMILAGKYFGIVYECVGGSIYFKVSPGQKGMFQISPSEVASTYLLSKTSLIQNILFNSNRDASFNVIPCLWYFDYLYWIL